MIIDTAQNLFNYALVIIVFIYFLFALILLRQVILMNSVVFTGVNKYLKSLAVIHLFIAFISFLALLIFKIF